MEWMVNGLERYGVDEWKNEWGTERMTEWVGGMTNGLER